MRVERTLAGGDLVESNNWIRLAKNILILLGTVTLPVAVYSLMGHKESDRGVLWFVFAAVFSAVTFSHLYKDINKASDTLRSLYIKETLIGSLVWSVSGMLLRALSWSNVYFACLVASLVLASPMTKLNAFEHVEWSGFFIINGPALLLVCALIHIVSSRALQVVEMTRLTVR